MKDYSVTITINVPITAASQAQADERAEKLGDAAVEGITRLEKKWVGDEVGPATTEVEEA